MDVRSHDESGQNKQILGCELDQKPIHKWKVISSSPDSNMWDPDDRLYRPHVSLSQFLILDWAGDFYQTFKCTKIRTTINYTSIVWWSSTLGHSGTYFRWPKASTITDGGGLIYPNMMGTCMLLSHIIYTLLGCFQTTWDLRAEATTKHNNRTERRRKKEDLFYVHQIKQWANIDLMVDLPPSICKRWLLITVRLGRW